MMHKSIFFILLGGLLLVVGAGCGVVKDNNTTGSASTTNNNQMMPKNWQGSGNAISTPFFDNQEKGTMDDLAVGKKVMVMGTTNDDGTISANQIMLGDFSSSTMGFFDNHQPGVSSTVRRGNNPTESNLNNTSAMADRAAQFRNRSGNADNFTGGNGQNAGAQMARKNSIKSMARAVGEILKKDDSSLVLKLEDGGSKIVFYSDKTEIFIVKSPPMTSATSTI